MMKLLFVGLLFGCLMLKHGASGSCPLMNYQCVRKAFPEVITPLSSTASRSSPFIRQEVKLHEVAVQEIECYLRSNAHRAENP